MKRRTRTTRSRFLLDTDTCIYLLNDVASVKERVREVGIERLAISIITVAELFFGAFYSERRDHNLQRVREFLAPPSPRMLGVSRRVVKRFGEIKADLKRRGQIIGDFDILIASTALVHRCTMVTNNQDHYGRIKGLSLENWFLGKNKGR